MNAGDLRDRVQIVRLVGARDGTGNVVGTEQTVATVWGNLRETPGREVVGAGRLEAPRTATLWTYAPAVAGVTESDTAVARGQRWNIRGVAPVGNDGRLVELLLETGAEV